MGDMQRRNPPGRATQREAAAEKFDRHPHGFDARNRKVGFTVTNGRRREAMRPASLLCDKLHSQLIEFHQRLIADRTLHDLAPRFPERLGR